MRKAFSAESIAKLLKTREGLLARLHAAEREEKALEEKRSIEMEAQSCKVSSKSIAKS